MIKKVEFPFLHSLDLCFQKNNTNEIILFKSLKHNAIEGCNINRIKEISNRINNLDFFSDDQDDFATSIFSEIIPTNLDKEGRFLIPENLKLHSNNYTASYFYRPGKLFSNVGATSSLSKIKRI